MSRSVHKLRCGTTEAIESASDLKPFPEGWFPRLSNNWNIGIVSVRFDVFKKKDMAGEVRKVAATNILDGVGMKEAGSSLLTVLLA